MKPRLMLADILKEGGAHYLAHHRLNTTQTKAWRAILACRTDALGGHIEQCDTCGTTRHIYHSCRNRHCPTCQMRAKENWIAQRNRELLPVPYFHLVFTLPHALNGLAGRHMRLITDILFDCVSKTLIEFGANPRWLGGEMAFSLVLHTWTQTLVRHLHLHALVAGGALAADGHWIGGKPGFLFPEKALSGVFRGKFMAALIAAHAAGQFQSDAPQTTTPTARQIKDANSAWRTLLACLRRHDWVVYAKAPLGGPAQVLEYLARYTHRIAISNERLVSLQGGTVTFAVRNNDASGPSKRHERLPVEAFIGRFMQHVLPQGLKRIRHYGILANCHKQQRLALCRAALNVPPPQPAVLEAVAAFMQRVAQIDIACCTYCKTGHFHVIAAIAPRHAGCAGVSPPQTGPPP